MTGYDRYAVYYAPEPGPLAAFGAGWLGWDLAAGAEPEPVEVAGLPRGREGLTETPRKYGFHGTIKPPFRLAEGASAEELQDAVGALAVRLKPVEMPGLALHRLGGFLALTPEGDARGLALLAGEVVMELDGFRAAPDAAEIARRRPEALSVRQREMLGAWGYPYVMDEFRFHLTLTGNLPAAEVLAVETRPAPGLGADPATPVPGRAVFAFVGRRATGGSAFCIATLFPAEARRGRPRPSGRVGPLFSTMRIGMP